MCVANNVQKYHFEVGKVLQIMCRIDVLWVIKMLQIVCRMCNLRVSKVFKVMSRMGCQDCKVLQIMCRIDWPGWGRYCNSFF